MGGTCVLGLQAPLLGQPETRNLSECPGSRPGRIIGALEFRSNSTRKRDYHHGPLRLGRRTFLTTRQTLVDFGAVSATWSNPIAVQACMDLRRMASFHTCLNCLTLSGPCDSIEDGKPHHTLLRSF